MPEGFVGMTVAKLRAAYSAVWEETPSSPNARYETIMPKMLNKKRDA